MHCTNCGAQLPDGSVFCTNCGTQMAEEEAKTFCTNCGSTVSASAVSCPTCGQALNAAPAPGPAKTSIDLKNLKNTTIFGIGGTAGLAILAGIAVAAIAVVILLISMLSGPTMPQDAIVNLIEKGNFTVVAKIDGEKVEMMVDLDLKKHELTMYAETDDTIIGIYDGQSFTYYKEYKEGYATDISDELDEFFEAYENYDKTDWEELAKTIEDLSGVDVEDYVNIKKFDSCYNTFEKNLAKKKWLEENADYSVETKKGVKIHTYEPDLYKLASASLECFEKAFEDEDDYEDLQDALKDVKSYLKMVKIELELGVKGKYLVSAEINAAGEKYSIEIEDIGKTKIDIDDLEDILDDCE